MFRMHGSDTDMLPAVCRPCSVMEESHELPKVDRCMTRTMVRRRRRGGGGGTGEGRNLMSINIVFEVVITIFIMFV